MKIKADDLYISDLAKADTEDKVTAKHIIARLEKELIDDELRKAETNYSHNLNELRAGNVKVWFKVV